MFDIFGFLDSFMWIIIVIDVIMIMMLLFWERSTPDKIMIWILVFLFLPIVGFVLYLFVGQTFYSRHAFEAKSLRDGDLDFLFAFEDAVMDIDGAMPEKKDTVAMARSIRNAGGRAYTNNNYVELYTLGQDKFDRMFEDIRNAKRFVHIEYYIIRNDKLGNELLQLLTDKVKEGVEVKLLTDAFGNGKGPKKAILKFRKAGGDFALFHSTLTLLLSPKKNNRNHRKIAVIDGEIGYCGGFNVGDEYLGKGPLGFWRDTAIRVQGGSLIPLSARFALDWKYASNEREFITDEKYYPNSLVDKFGDDITQMIAGGPDIIRNNPVRMQYLEMMRAAKKTLYIHTPYLAPNDSLSDSLKLAAMSGIDVRIIIPDKPDHPFVYWNNISAANDLMLDGVKVYMYNRGFVHSKTIVVDGKYSSVGSANLDDRSLSLNFETNMLIYSDRIGRQMDDAFMDDLEYCTEYSCEKYAERTMYMKFKIGISRLFRGFA